MRILLTTSQFDAISEFCIDVAKGLMLAGILGQGFANIASIFVRIFSSVLILLLSFAFLYVGVLLKKK